MEKMISSIASIQSSMYYIPGNHDPITSFANETCLVSPATPPTLPYNLDKKFVYITPSLCIAGFGGSLPAHLSSTGEKVWDGFPYKTEKEYTHAVKDLTDGLFKQDSVLQPNDLLIFMTHAGPTEPGTTYQTEDVKSPIVTGSKKLLHSLKTPKAQKHCILHVHGHTHACSGKTFIGSIPVTNSGSIMEGGRFEIYELQKDPWQVSAMSYYSL
ncbi:uncharacterized protein [Dysidea avara]|uniref:uncharacterized protein n=1 Tax=Dysidea avara TaxID=196820 RepID=UPI0033182CAB